MNKIVIHRLVFCLISIILILLTSGDLFAKQVLNVFNKERSVNEDIIYFQNGDVLRGNILNKTFLINTSYGSLSIKADKCAGLSYSKTKDSFTTLLTVNFNKITGWQNSKTVQFRIGSFGRKMNIPTEKILYLIFKRKITEKNFNGYGIKSNLYVMNNGDTLTGKLENNTLEFETEYGNIPIPISDITQLVFPEDFSSDVTLIKQNGDKVTGKLKTMTFTLLLNLDTSIQNIYQDKIAKIVTRVSGLKAFHKYEFTKKHKKNKLEKQLLTKKEFKNVLGMDFKRIRPGSFLMGSPKSESGRNQFETRHLVTLDHPFFIQTTQVTQKQWKELMGSNPSQYKGDQRPVENVSWFDAQLFIEKLNELDKTLDYRLPTEAEWEYAARAGSKTAYYFGNSSKNLGSHAWFEENSDERTHYVAKKKPNPWGLYDMYGNVWEWCLDKGRWDKGVITNTYNNNINNPVSDIGEDRINRGGSFRFHQRFCRSSSRYCNAPGSKHSSIGFRLTGHIKN
ncbi:MAG: formylglycine-generating enzyme family protein [Desulfobacteraceae bacterium]|nr:formylglycine-generating enzyme family protein [Desulfobacteraceae bacterium]